MRRHRQFASLFLCVAALRLGAARPLHAAADAGAPGEWLQQYTTARTLGLGGAYVAIANDPLGVMWNPAGLPWMNQDEARFENAQLFDQTSINGFSVAVPGNWLPSIGVTMLALRMGSFQRTNDVNDNLGTFNVGETAYLLTLAHSLSPRLTVGLNAKLLQQTVEAASGAGVGLDLGAIASLTPNLHIGASLANLGGPSITLRTTAETSPLTARGGAALTLFQGRGLVALELDHSDGLGTRVHAGTEYWLFPSFGLRAGYLDGRTTGGFSYRLAPQYQIDYAAADDPLGVTHRIGLAWRFGGFYASSLAQPADFSPTGEQPVTRILLNARTKAETDSWTLDVVNKSETLVRRFGGTGKPPAHVEWDGKDETGLPLPDGIYRYRLAVTDRVGRVVTSPEHTVEISTAGPQGKVPLAQTP